jgi:hypothetical protein
MSLTYHFEAGVFLEDFDRYFEEAENRIQFEEDFKQIASKLEGFRHAEIRHHGTLFSIR